MSPHAAPRSRFLGLPGLVASIAVLSIVGCQSDAGASKEDQPTPDPPVVAAPRLLVVDPAIIKGLDVSVASNSNAGRLTFVTFPIVPGAEPWTEAMRASSAEELDRFVEDVAVREEAPFPELLLGWALVAASPAVIGVRLATDTIGLDGEEFVFDGKAETTWFDVEQETIRPATDLVDPARTVLLLERIAEAAKVTQGVDEQALLAQLQGELESFNSIAFTPEGELWIEFDGRQLSSSSEPIGLEVKADGLLSSFGEMARRAALSPADPALPPAETATTKASATELPQPDPTSPPAPTDAVDCAQEKCIALTFDDGPVDGTSDLLDLLAEKGVRATFFMVGTNVRAHPEIVARMVRDGHSLGNHTFDHPQLTRLSTGAATEQISRTNDLIEAASGARPTMLRPPYGATNDSVAAVAEDLGMAQILWNVDPEDWKDRDAQIVTERVLSNARRGSIVLSHDIHETTRDAYPAIIDSLQADGFRLVTVPELLGAVERGQKYSSG